MRDEGRSILRLAVGVPPCDDRDMGWVLDACVAVKCFLAEPYSPHAHALLASGGTFLVPDLFFIECAAILCKAVQKGRCSPARADRALADLSA